MERPIFITVTATDDGSPRTADRARSDSRLEIATGLRTLVHGFAGFLAFGVLGHSVGMAFGLVGAMPSEVAAQHALALAVLAGSAAALGISFVLLRREAPGAIHDRSPVGCAWFGAPDAIVAQCFLFGGAIASLYLLAEPSAGPFWFASGTVRYADWHLVPAMVLAFATIAVAPIAEEFMLRGVMFATLRTRVDTLGAAVLVTATVLPLHYATIADHPWSAVGPYAVAAGAMFLRIRHASLAPAIALHCGHNFMVCVVAALG